MPGIRQGLTGSWQGLRDALQTVHRVVHCLQGGGQMLADARDLPEAVGQDVPGDV
ncbi:hypothetical protein [Zoogloea sp.]|uniref:hypothetical protein n=1 Tax=Zoogloea sp. TaxID=49181 RepID=UPI0035B01453